jgi:hypothetical protein
MLRPYVFPAYRYFFAAGAAFAHLSSTMTAFISVPDVLDRVLGRGPPQVFARLEFDVLRLAVGHREADLAPLHDVDHVGAVGVHRLLVARFAVVLKDLDVRVVDLFGERLRRDLRGVLSERRRSGSDRR